MGDPAEQAARDVGRMLAGLPGLRRLVEAAADLVDAPLARWPEGSLPARSPAGGAEATEPPHADGMRRYGRGADSEGPGGMPRYGR